MQSERNDVPHRVVALHQPVPADLTPKPAVTLRAVLLALALIPVNTWWVVQIEYVRYSDNSTTSALFFNVVTMLLLLLAANAILSRVAPRLMLSRGEMLVVYIMLTASTVMVGHDQLQILISTLAVIVGRATPANQWATLIHPYLPAHLVVTDRAIIDPMFYGGSSLVADGYWRAWLRPLAWWGLFAILLVWVMLCIINIFRRQWDAEHLSYPIAELPLAVTSESFFRQRLLWVGITVGAIPQIVNLIHAVNPAVPEIPVGGHYYSLPGSWGRLYMQQLPIFSFPFIYGLAYLLPVQLMSSYLIFLFLSRLELATAVHFGYMDQTGFPYVPQQGTGACAGLVMVILWTARGHLKMIWRQLWGRARVEDSDEALPYRTASFGLTIGTAALVAFLVLAGMRFATAALYLAFFLMVVVSLARLRAELGLPTFELAWTGADQVLRRIAGDRALARNELSMFALLYWLTRTQRQLPILTQADALRIGRRSRIPLRGVAGVLLLSSAVGIVAAFFFLLQALYHFGFDSAKMAGPGMYDFGLEPIQSLLQALQTPADRDLGAIGAYLFGAGFTIFLGAMRTRLLWWPLHPIGYLASGSIGVFRLWLPIFITWIVKALLLRYGGLRSYRTGLPFFLGLILGEFAAGFVRTIIDLAFGLYLPVGSGIGGL